MQAVQNLCPVRPAARRNRDIIPGYFLTLIVLVKIAVNFRIRNNINLVYGISCK